MMRPAGYLALALLGSTSGCYGYTVLTHEAIIDAVWDTNLKNVLLRRFPAATPEDLLRAHAFAYGGCIIQDMGYYPFSSKLFSDLTHYVRSGDFVVALIRESRDLDEYAFALGAMEHYAADTDGHGLATNRAVPILYPRLAQKFGKDVTYWDNPTAHIRTEFGFDVLQVTAGRYAPDQYHSFIGFQVAKDLLERAFLETYDLPMKDVFENEKLAFGSYRWSVRSVIPEMTRVAWSMRQNQLKKAIPGVTRKKFLYNLSRASFEREWGSDYPKPGLGARLLAFLVELLPAAGPFSAVHIKTPTPDVEKLFMASFNAALDRYKAELTEALAGEPSLPNENLDAGGAMIAGSYKGTDQAYARLIAKLSSEEFAGLRPDLRRNILAYYKDMNPSPPAASNATERAEFTKLQSQLARLKALPETTAAAPPR